MKDGQPKSLSRRDFMGISGLGLAAMAFGPGFEGLGPEGPEVRHKFLDVLSYGAQVELARKADALIRPTSEGANALANELKNVEKYSDANNICGPLAIAQLNHVVSYGIRSEDFWLLDPKTVSGAKLLEEGFPQSRFDKYEVTTPLGDYDFSSWTGHGVEPGDFFFFRAKDRGSSHMVAISRRGNDGKIYCITNYPDSTGKFIIKEVVFWDPANPEISWVKELAKGENTAKFASGNAGFYQFRLKQSETSSYDLMDQSPEGRALREQIDSLAHGAVGEWHAYVKNLGTGKVVAEVGSRLDQHAASQFKVPLAMIFMSYFESKSKDESDFKNSLVKYSPLLKAMLVESDEDATNKLTQVLIDYGVNRQAIIDGWRVGDTNISERHVTAEALSNCFERIFNSKSGTFRFQSTYRYLLDILSMRAMPTTPIPKTRLETLRDPKFGLQIAGIAEKLGSIQVKGGIYVCANSGIIQVVNSKDKSVAFYSVSFTGGLRKDNKATYGNLEDEMTSLIAAFAGYAKRVNG